MFMSDRLKVYSGVTVPPENPKGLPMRTKFCYRSHWARVHDRFPKEYFKYATSGAEALMHDTEVPLRNHP
jgi:hypothetical protein